MDKTCNHYNTTHNKKIDSFLVKCEYILVFNNDSNPHVKTNFYHITNFFNVKIYFLYWIDIFSDRKQKFSHINEMLITPSIIK